MNAYERFEEAARGNVEQHLSDVSDYVTADNPEANGEDVMGAIYNDAYVLAFDGALAAGADPVKAREIATRVAQCYAQP
jgi:hypothetical protein